VDSCYITITSMSGEIENHKDFLFSDILHGLKNVLSENFKINFHEAYSNENDVFLVNKKENQILNTKCDVCDKIPYHKIKIRLKLDDGKFNIFVNIPSCCGYKKCEDVLKDICLFFKDSFEESSFFMISSQPEVFSENFKHPTMSLSDLRDSETFIRRVKV